MENNPRKSKAFIITFILILILLVLGYFLFKNRDNLFGTKGSSSVSKIFSPLLGTSKDKDLKVIEDPSVTGGDNTGTTTSSKITGLVITDTNGNKLVLAQAGEDLKKGDVLYISGFNTNKQPIVMKAIANDVTKSIVFGVAAEDIKMGSLGNILIEGILSGIPTNRKEGTLWAINNPLYLSDKVFGGMTKNPPVSPSFTVLVASVLTVDKVNGSIRIGDLDSNKNLNSLTGDMLDYWNSIFRPNKYKTKTFPFVPIEYPENKYCSNGATNYPTCTTNQGKCVNGATNYPACTTGNDDKCKNGADNPPLCTTKKGVCANGADNPTLCTTKKGECLGGETNPPACTIIDDGRCKNGADNPSLCTTKNGECLGEETNPPACTIIDDGRCKNGADNPSLCTTKNGECLGGETNPPTCTTKEQPVEKNKCEKIEQNPLTFTPEEKARLAILLRKFYLISSTLKTDEDITTIYNEIDQQKAFVTQIQGLINQCYAQVDGKGLMNSNLGWVRHGNPWYTKTSGGAYPYTDSNTGYTDYNWLQSSEGPGCKAVSGYYSGKLEKPVVFTDDTILGKFEGSKAGKVTDILTFGLRSYISRTSGLTKNTTVIGKTGDSCEIFNSFPGYGVCHGTFSGTPVDSFGQPYREIIEAGCQWKDGVFLDDTERVLNIW